MKVKKQVVSALPSMGTPLDPEGTPDRQEVCQSVGLKAGCGSREQQRDRDAWREPQVMIA